VCARVCRYVEKRLLEEKILKLDAEVRDRDVLDAQIETCVAGLFERMRLLEKTNKELEAQVSNSPGGGDGARIDPGEDAQETAGPDE